MLNVCKTHCCAGHCRAEKRHWSQTAEVCSSGALFEKGSEVQTDARTNASVSQHDAFVLGDIGIASYLPSLNPSVSSVGLYNKKFTCT